MSPHIPDPASDHRTAFSRRAGLRAAALGAAGLGVTGLGAASAAPSHAAPAGSGGGRTPRAGEEAAVAVSAITLWVEPRTNRPGIDDPSLTNPVDLDAWNANMEDTETRRWLTGELESQAVLGSRVVVDEIDGDWAHVVVTAQPTPRDERGYPGWVPLAQLVADDSFLERAASAPTATVTALTSRLTGTPSGNHPGIPVSFDTILPVLGRAGGAVKVAVPGGRPAYLPAEDVVVRESGEVPPLPTVEDVIATGERFLGLRYLWAGVSAWGFDCSGFTYTLFHHHGIPLHRDAGPQMRNSGLQEITAQLQEVEREDLQRGDLVFFSTEPGAESIRHVAMYLGDDQIMQAPNAARSVEIMSLTEYDTDGEYAGARRVALAG